MCVCVEETVDMVCFQRIYVLLNCVCVRLVCVWVSAHEYRQSLAGDLDGLQLGLGLVLGTEFMSSGGAVHFFNH